MLLCNFCFENKKLILIPSQKHIYFMFLFKSLQQNAIFFILISISIFIVAKNTIETSLTSVIPC
jgi:hypothetical protein